jgi:hypothetical protein
MVDLSVFGEIGLTQNDVELLGRGRNGLVVKILSGEFEGNVAKHYGANRHHEADRLAREFESLTFLNSGSGLNVPRPLRKFEEERIAIYSRMPGTRPQAEANVVGPMVRFISQLFEAHRQNPSAWRHSAAEASFEVGDILRQVERRLLISSDDEAIDPRESQALGALSSAFTKAHTRVSPPQKLKLQTLSQSDFGPHNMLQHKDEFAFVDFEYFGIDSVSRVVLDVLWHPGTRMEAASRINFVSQAIELFAAEDPLLGDEVLTCLPLIGLRWVAIMTSRAASSSDSPTGSQMVEYLSAVDGLLESRQSLDDQVALVAQAVSP